MPSCLGFAIIQDIFVGVTVIAFNRIIKMNDEVEESDKLVNAMTIMKQELKMRRVTSTFTSIAGQTCNKPF